MTPIIAAAIGLLAGSGAGYFLFLRVLTGKADSIVREVLARCGAGVPVYRSKRSLGYEALRMRDAQGGVCQ